MTWGNANMIGYETKLGQCICEDSLNTLAGLPDDSINLIMTSPPFSLQRKKKYRDFEEKSQDEYVDWLIQWGKAAYDKLAPDGSFVIDLGGAYEHGRPVRSLYQYEFILRMCKELGYNLCQDVYWYNTSALPLPIEYVNKRHERLKSAVNLNLWFCKTDRPKCNNQNVLVPYSDRMKRFISKPEEFIGGETAVRPSGNVMVTKTWARDNGGAIPSNVLQIPNSASNDLYLRTCKSQGLKAHPARYCYKLVEFWVKFCSDEGDLVVDPFSGSNITGKVSEDLNRRWLSIDISPEYVASSSWRFRANSNEESKLQYDRIISGDKIILG